MPEIYELDAPTCERLLRGGVFGRFALVTPEGPDIVPVNYSVQGGAIVWNGYSVIARGVGELLATLPAPERDAPSPRPWPTGDRWCVLRMTWTSLSGRRVGRHGGVGSLLSTGPA